MHTETYRHNPDGGGETWLARGLSKAAGEIAVGLAIVIDTTGHFLDTTRRHIPARNRH